MTAEGDRLRELLRIDGVPEEFVAVWAQAPPPDPGPLARGPEHTWLAAPLTDGTWVVGGNDRGSFAVYDRYETVELCANAVRHLYGAPVEAVPLDDAGQQTGATLATALSRRIAAGGPVDDVPVGVVLDRYGPLSGHVLFAWRTPFPQRAAPPTDLNQPYVQLLVRRPLPRPFRTGVMAPAFEQPGGGAAVSLPRCVRWYFDAGYLDVVTTDLP